MKKIPFFGLLGILFWACAPSPKAIQYGSELCHFCKMTVVDKLHAAQLVTQKGKVYVFDAIECMVHFQEAHPELNYQFQLVNDYESPGVLIEAADAMFLISPEIPSPMGAFLSAFSSKDRAEAVRREKGGVTLKWAELPRALDESMKMEAMDAKAYFTN